MPKVLTEGQLRSFSRNGFLGNIPVLEPAEADRIRMRMEQFERAHGEAKQWAWALKANLLFRWLHDVCRRPEILDPMEDLLGPNIFLSQAIFGIKEPHKENRVGWHQDQQMVYVHPYFVICNLAITDTTEENGCLRFIPGSHKDRVLPHGYADAEEHGFELFGNDERQLEIKSEIDTSNAVSVPLRKGEMLFFHAKCIHGSEPNRSADRRIKILIDYVPTYAFQESGRGGAQLVRGVDTFGHFTPDPVPDGDFTAQAIAEWRSAIGSYSDNIYTGRDLDLLRQYVQHANRYARA